MWQISYLLHRARMAELFAEAERERRWRLQDAANGRSAAPAMPGAARVLAARAAAAISRGAARVARRLDDRAAPERHPERLLPEA